jgi:hypothetical protein
MVLVLGTTYVYSEENRKCGIGVNYLGVGLKYFLSKKVGLEWKTQFDAGIILTGVRGYFYVRDLWKFLFFAGIETDYVLFKTDKITGDGFVYGIFIGSEYFLLKRVSIQLDIGPYGISLRDRNTGIMLSSMDYVVNFGINWYFK